MSKNKIKWFVQPAPTGKWKSFETRGWPTAENQDGRLIAIITCPDQYVPRKVASGEHAPLTVKVMDWRQGNDIRKWRPLTQQATCMTEAKAMVKRFYEENPEWLPEPKEMVP